MHKGKSQAGQARHPNLALGQWEARLRALRMEIEDAAKEHGGLEWYLHNHFDALERSHAIGNGGSEPENASRSLLRFCSDSKGWGPALYRECIEIAEEGLRISKESRK